MKKLPPKEKLAVLALAFLAFTVLIFGTSSVKRLGAASQARFTNTSAIDAFPTI